MNRTTAHRTRAAAAAALLTAAIALTACGSDETSGDDRADDAAAAPTADAAAPAAPAAPGSEPAEPADVAVPDALQFQATTVAGEAFDGASVAGRPVVLWFWAPWCAVCKSQAPEVTELADEYGDDVAFIGVGSLSDAGEIESFAGDVAGPTHLSDPDGELYQRFGITEQSSFVVLDAAGDEVLRTGYSDDDELAGTVAELAG